MVTKNIVWWHSFNTSYFKNVGVFSQLLDLRVLLAILLATVSHLKISKIQKFPKKFFYGNKSFHSWKFCYHKKKFFILTKVFDNSNWTNLKCPFSNIGKVLCKFMNFSLNQFFIRSLMSFYKYSTFSYINFFNLIINVLNIFTWTY